jgi:NADPH:quinone reductase
MKPLLFWPLTLTALASMRVIEISEYGDADVLRVAERPRPDFGADEVLIEVEAAGLSRADVAQRRGKYPPPPGVSDVPGLDCAGTVIETGVAVRDYKPGDRVCALVSGGGYAEYCAAPAVQVLPIPEDWTAVEATSLPENMFTVFDMLVLRLRLGMGESVLVHGGTSGIGSTAIMLARAMGAIPFATAGSDEKCAACLTFGAAHAINYRTHDFVAEIARLTAGRGVDVILDIVGGDYLPRNLDTLAVEGRIGHLSPGSTTAQLDLRKLMAKRATIVAAGMRVRTPSEKGEIARALHKHVWPLLPARNPIRPVIDCSYPLDQAVAAHARMEDGNHVGKIVLTMR